MDKTKEVENRKAKIECTGPFGSSEEYLPVDVQTLFERMSTSANSEFGEVFLTDEFYGMCLFERRISDTQNK